MTDYYLRFIDRYEAVAVLASVGIPDGPTHDTAVDHVGEVVLESAPIDTRHHVNLRCRNPLNVAQLDILAGYLVYPDNPVRVWG